MNRNRLSIFLIAMCLSLAMMAQNQLNNTCAKAQRSLIEYLRLKGLSPSIDTRDNSVCFKKEGVFYWVTFDGEVPVLYTIHRKGIKYESDSTFKPSCASIACNEVNNKHKIKCIYGDKRVDFIIQTYAKEPSDFHGGFDMMLTAFNHAEDTFKGAYNKAFSKWKEDSIAAKAPITQPWNPGTSPLKIQQVAFGNFDMAGNPIADYNQPLHRSNCRFIKTLVTVSSSEKGIFKIAMKITNPDGKPMIAFKGSEYASSQNLEISKINKPIQCELQPFGADNDTFWKAGEYKVEIYDFEKGVVLYNISFNLL